MRWSSLSEFISMGGYGFYVWGSYLVTFVLLGAEVLMLLKRKRSVARTTTQNRSIETSNSKLETAL